MRSGTNIDDATVEGFGYEWTRFDQRAVPELELRRYFDAYFSQFPWNSLPKEAAGFDLGCGSGRWAKFVSERVGYLHCIDASAEALGAATRTLAQRANVEFHVAAVDRMPLAESSMDFGYSIGVLHHVPDTVAGIRSCASKLKPGAPFLVYLYYALENRPLPYRAAWWISNAMRHVIASLPYVLRHAVTTLIAATVYWPVARLALVAELMRIPANHFPLGFYRRASFRTMCTDAFDRFGTKLEKRFTRAEIARMLEAGGFERIAFRDAAPYWCALAYRRGASG